MFDKKLIFETIQKKDVLFLDDGYVDIKLEDFKKKVIDFKYINIFCAFKTMLLFFFKKDKHLGLKQFYKQTLYRMYSPEVVVAHHINGRGVECKYLCPEIKVLIYQFAYCPKKFVKKYINCKGKYDTEGGYLDSILVYHEEDEKTLDIPKSKIFIGGSVKNNNISLLNIKKNENSIMYISEFDPNLKKDHYHLECESFTIKTANEYCEKYKKNLYIALRSNRADKKNKAGYTRESELSYFRNLIGNNFKYSNSDSYELANRSELIICMSSNLGIELLARNFKVLFLPYHDHFGEEIYPYLPKENNFFVYRDYEKKEIFNKINNLLIMPENSWVENLHASMNLVKFDKGNKIFKDKLKTLINGQQK